MKSTKRTLILMLLAVTPIVFYGCKGTQETQDETSQVSVDTVLAEPEAIPEPEIEPEPEIVEPAPARPAPVAQRKAPAKEEVLYIRGYGANGTVWGHVTMKGDKGKGTVTDQDENALTITCTRQGDELICYDQNSRQYIFKL